MGSHCKPELLGIHSAPVEIKPGMYRIICQDQIALLTCSLHKQAHSKATAFQNKMYGTTNCTYVRILNIRWHTSLSGHLNPLPVQLLTLLAACEPAVLQISHIPLSRTENTPSSEAWQSSHLLSPVSHKAALFSFYFLYQFISPKYYSQKICCKCGSQRSKHWTDITIHNCINFNYFVGDPRRSHLKKTVPDVSALWQCSRLTDKVVQDSVITVKVTAVHSPI